MEGVAWQYESTWRASANFLWSLALVMFALGVLAESFLAGSIAASGGLAIAVTTPFFGVAIAKQQAYELDLQLARNNMSREANLGRGYINSLGGSSAPRVEELTESAEESANNFEAKLTEHQRFSKSIVYAQAWIVGLASGVWATGSWLGNMIFHCGRATC